MVGEKKNLKTFWKRHFYFFKVPCRGLLDKVLRCQGTSDISEISDKNQQSLGHPVVGMDDLMTA